MTGKELPPPVDGRKWAEHWEDMLEKDLAISFHDLSVIVDRLLNGGAKVHEVMNSVSEDINIWVKEREREDMANKAVQMDLERAKALLQKG